MAQILRQPVGNVLRGMGGTPQQPAEFRPRVGAQQPVFAFGQQCFRQPENAEAVAQGGGGQADAAGNPDVVAHPCAAAAQRLPLRGFADNGEAEAQAAAGGVAADETHAVTLRLREQAAAEGLQPVFVELRQRGREQHPARLCAHRRHIGNVYGHDFVRQRVGRVVGEEMAALQKHIGAQVQITAGRRADNGGIVADAQHHAVFRLPCGGQIAADKVKFVHGRQPEKRENGADYRR